MTHIQELGNVIRHLHGAKATYLESVPVKETFQGQTVWDGVVEVFSLKGHPKTDSNLRMDTRDGRSGATRNAM